MAYKFDGKSLKEGSKTICHIDGKYIKLGASDSKTQLAGFIMCRVEGNLIKEMEDDDTILCRVEGKDIKEGSNGKTMIKISDAASAIGSKSENNLIAAMWYLFCRL
jgi:hypothetical protein|tara:strand:+ start:180 stop:497 length:318 start_codon:yes stop_codon:yes gene_type:complete